MSHNNLSDVSRGSMEFTGERFVPEVHGNIELEHLHRYLFACKAVEGKVVLDIACGEGYGSDMLAQTALKVTGVDISLEAVLHAQCKYKADNLEFLVGSCKSIPLGDASVDVIVSFETIEHHGEHEAMMKEVRRVLRPDGILIISSPDKLEYSDKPNYRNEYHVKELYREEFQALLASHFSSHTIYGQRVIYGSAILCENRDTPSESYEYNEGKLVASVGVPHAVYLVAVASNSALPVLGSGILEQRIENSELTRFWQGQTTSRDVQIADLSQAVRERDCQITSMNQAVGERDTQIADLSQAVRERDCQITSMNQAVGERDTQIADLSQAVRERDCQITSMNQAVRERDGQIALIYNSHSWRLTQPLRAIGLTVSRIKPGIINQLRYLWRILPLGSKQKAKIKAAASHYFSSAIRLQNGSPNSVTDAALTNSTGDGSNPYADDYRDRFSLAFNRHGKDFVPLADDIVKTERIAVKVIAFYLPQFHPIPENDKNWGQGFTEWTNVCKATPQFAGHYQPRLPGELGFYDLRLKEIQRRQIELARQHGIHGFCYHHYWFNGKKVLEKPFQQVLNDPTLDFPFSLCWANENWTRRWDGGDHDIILAQNHSPEDDLAFFEDILPALKDRRYIRIDDRPLLIVYRPELLPDAAATAMRWRQAAAEAGLPGLFIASAATFGFDDYGSIGYDGLVQFPPHNIRASEITDRQILLNKSFSGHVYDYSKYAENAINAIAGKKHVFPCVMMNWDNEARKPGKGNVFLGGTPKNYKSWLRQCFDFVHSNNIESERLVFVNAWNEWAEGTYLEPDRRYGYAYLHATADLLRHYSKPVHLDDFIRSNNARFTKRHEVALVVHLYYFDLFDELCSLISELDGLDVFVTVPVHFSEDQLNKIIETLKNVYLVMAENRGRDILPFLIVFPVVTSFGYDYLVKVHSKKSPHRPDGVFLRQHAWGELLDPTNVTKIIRAFGMDEKVGLIGPSNSICSLSNTDYLVNNRDHLKRCLSRLGFGGKPLTFNFIAGSMFWARVNALKMLNDLDLGGGDFEEELGQLDGTMAHALERLFCFLGELNGYSTATVEQIGKDVTVLRS